MTRLFDIREFGVGSAIATTAIQAAIDACHAAGGGVVYCPPGVFLTGTLWLKSHVTLHLEAGCRLLGSPDRADYTENPFPESVAFADEKVANAHLIVAYRAINVTISGRGVIDGNSATFLPHLTSSVPMPSYYWDWRPGQLVFFCQCEDVRVADVRIDNAPYWTLFLHGCNHVKISGISISNPDWTPNGDGIDVDCCRDVCIDSCQIRSGDDAITLRAYTMPLGDRGQPCENVVVTNCVLHSRCNAIRVGVGAGVISDCTFSNLVIRESGIGINIISNYPTVLHSAEIRRLRFANIVMDAHLPIYVSTGADGRAPVRDIVFSGIDARGSTASFVGGTPVNPVTGITLHDLRLQIHGGKTNRSLPAEFSGNPEWTFRSLGIPCGLCLVEARDIRLDGVCLRWDAIDGHWQHAILAQKVESLRLSRVTAASPATGEAGSAAIRCIDCHDLLLHSCVAEPGTEVFLAVAESDKQEATVRLIANDFTHARTPVLGAVGNAGTVIA